MAGTNGVTNPVMDYAHGASIRDWPSTLDGVLKLDFDTVIPGYGAVTTKDGLIAHRNKIAAIKERVTTMVHKGKSKDKISQMLLQQFDWKLINMRGVDGMMAELKAR